MGRKGDSALRVLNAFRRRLVLDVPTITKQLTISTPSIRKAIGTLESMEILKEITGRKRGKQYVYDRYLAILSEGTQPL